ncbi:MAG: ATP-binding protein [Gammaproteobacteria bacterium]|nr:ATP-binding protein [Gammaproteobacteria bacterium]MYH86050.1 ATP-binding protein [Gammaproteobacteria bacterium]
MNATRPSIRKFNPGTFQSDDELMRQFVVRKHELHLVLEVLSENINAKSCQHILVAGPRGRGKTMLLARVCAELRTNKALSQHLLPVRFMEESQEIANLADFWLEALFHLAKTTAATNPEFSEELLGTHGDLAARWQDSNFEELVRAAVLGAADRIGRKLVLMVENMQSLSADLDSDFGWKLRKTLQTEPQIILLATATSQFKGLGDADGPFFELFRIIHLDPLTVSECVELWRMASGEERDNREIKPLRILTGGSPRLLVIVATYAEHRSLRQLLEELVALVDDHTEYFRGHLEAIAKTERRVYLAVLDLWQASSPAEIASRARMDVRSVSALLARLANRGIVLVEGSGRKRLYSATERLYSIYYKLRRERDEAAVVQQLIQFMTVFYSSEKLDEIFEVIQREAIKSPVIRDGFQRAISVGKLTGARIDRAKELFAQVQAADNLLKEASGLYRTGKLEESIEACEKVIDQFGNSDVTELQKLVAIALVHKGLSSSGRGELDLAMEVWDAIIDRFGNCGKQELEEEVALALVNKGVMHKYRDEPEIARSIWRIVAEQFRDSDSPELQVLVATSLSYLASVQIELGNAKDALNIINSIEKRFRAFDQDWRFALQLWRTMLTKSCALFALRDPPAALDAFRQTCVGFDPQDNEMIGYFLARLPALIALGASAGDLAEVLTTEGIDDGFMDIVIVALRKISGETVRAPAEVLEVAEDLRKQIESYSSTGDWLSLDSFDVTSH